MPNWVQCRVIVKDETVLEKYLTHENDDVVLDFNKVIPMPEDLNKTIGKYEYVNPNSLFLSIYVERIEKKQKHLTELLDKVYEEVNGKDLTMDEFTFLASKNKEVIDELYKVFTTEEDRDEVKVEKYFKDTDDTFFKDYNMGLDNVIRGYYNCKKYGDVDWYYWHVRNWGTKWNATNTFYEEGTNFIDFQTAWSMPEGIIKKIAEETPIRIMFADEDYYSDNCGIIQYEKDEETGDINEICLFTVNDIDNKYIPTLSYSIWGYDLEELFEGDDEPLYTEEDKENVQAIWNKVDSYFEM